MKAQAEKTSLWGIILMVLFTSMTLISCGGDDEDATGGIVAGSDGVVTTGVARDVTYSTATITGTIDASFLKDATSTCRFGISYGKDIDADDSKISTDEITGTTFTLPIEYLAFGTVYYYKAYVYSNGNYIYGSTHKFTTSKLTLTSGDAIDLGLPSGTKWASHNVGASDPEEFGDYFAWGETSTKSSYDSNNYNIEMLQTALQSRGIIDSNNNLTATYDAATVNWGDAWRMPTASEADELLSTCNLFLTEYHGVRGYVAIGKNNNSIFFPAAGAYIGKYLSSNYGPCYNYYWCASANFYGIACRPYCIEIRYDSRYPELRYPDPNPEFDPYISCCSYSGISRGIGCSVRPVRK